MGVFSDLDDYSKEQLCDAALAAHVAAKKGVDKVIAPGTPDYEYWLKREGLAKFKRAYKLKAPTVIIPRALVPEEMLGNKQGEINQVKWAHAELPAGHEVNDVRNIARMLDEFINVNYGEGAVYAARVNQAARRAVGAQPVFPPVEWAVPERAAIAPQVFVDEFNPEDPF